MNTYPLGAGIILSFRATLAPGRTAPALLVVRVLDPDGNETTMTVAQDGQDPTLYHAEVVANKTGTWHVRATSTVPQGAAEHAFVVERSAFG